MQREDVTAKLAGMDSAAEMLWMLRLGTALTVAARSSYRPDPADADPRQLVQMNELLHRVFGRLVHLQLGDSSWSKESFVELLWEYAREDREIAGALRRVLLDGNASRLKVDL